MRWTSVAWNLFGLGVPLAVAVLTIPQLIARLGLERYGILALAWSLIGISGIFDLGVGRATTQAVARLRGANDVQKISLVVAVAFWLALVTGIIGGLLLSLAILCNIEGLMHLRPSLMVEVRDSGYLIASIIPIQSVSAMYRGTNEAFGNFRGISVLRAFLGLFNFVGPLVLSIFTEDIAIIVFLLLLSKVVSLIVFKSLADRCLDLAMVRPRKTPTIYQFAEFGGTLLTFGGWNTVSSAIAPFLTQADRFLIGSLISPAAVTGYAVPFDLVSQGLFIPSSIATVAFPSLASSLATNHVDARTQFQRWLLRLSALMLAVSIAFALSLPIFLPWWTNHRLPASSVYVGQILCIGLFANSIGSLYYAMVQAHGRADVTALLHMIELPIYLFTLYILTVKMGITGAAIAWSARVTLDAMLLAAVYYSVSLSRRRVGGC